jgi:hypothetical protein
MFEILYSFENNIGEEIGAICGNVKIGLPRGYNQPGEVCIEFYIGIL